VFRPARLTPDELEAGYWRAYERFYRWSNILRGASTKDTLAGAFRHAAYAGGWKKLEPMWDLVIRARRASSMLPVLERVLGATGAAPRAPSRTPASPRGATPAPTA
jgi:hypothetical protein